MNSKIGMFESLEWIPGLQYWSSASRIWGCCLIFFVTVWINVFLTCKLIMLFPLFDFSKSANQLSNLSSVAAPNLVTQGFIPGVPQRTWTCKCRQVRSILLRMWRLALDHTKKGWDSTFTDRAYGTLSIVAPSFPRNKFRDYYIDHPQGGFGDTARSFNFKWNQCFLLARLSRSLLCSYFQTLLTCNTPQAA